MNELCELVFSLCNLLQYSFLIEIYWVKFKMFKQGEIEIRLLD